MELHFCFFSLHFFSFALRRIYFIVWFRASLIAPDNDRVIECRSVSFGSRHFFLCFLRSLSSNPRILTIFSVFIFILPFFRLRRNRVDRKCAHAARMPTKGYYCGDSWCNRLLEHLFNGLFCQFITTKKGRPCRMASHTKLCICKLISLFTIFVCFTRKRCVLAAASLECDKKAFCDPFMHFIGLRAQRWRWRRWRCGWCRR